MIFKPKTVLGKPEVVSLQGAYFKVRYKVKIRKPKNYNNDILDRLLYLGFEIIRVACFSLTLLLPCHWWAAKVGGSIVFHDHVGRIRIIQKKEIEFMRRYRVALLEDPHKNVGYDSFLGCIIDYTAVSKILPLTKDFKLNAVIDAKGDLEKLETLYIRECHRIMDTMYPAWQIETMYWDDPIEEAVIYEDE